MGAVVKEALRIKSMRIICEQQEEQLRSMKTKNDLAEELVSNYEKNMEIAASASAMSLNEQRPEGEKWDEEELSKMEQSIKLLGDLMSKGVEIYSALEAPQEVKEVFPAQPATLSLSRPKAQITDKTGE